MSDDDNKKLKVVPLNPLIERIKQLMENPPEGSVVLEITPDVARYVLQNWHGRYNRHEKSAAIKRYAEDMANRRWLLNGSTIVFTDSKLLGDGQNRLMACIRSGTWFRTHVIFGIPHDYFHSIDQGRIRTPADIFKMAGVPNSNPVSHAVRWVEILETTKPGTHPKRHASFTGYQLLQLYKDKHKAVEDWLPEARAIFGTYRQPIPILMAALHLFNKVDPNLVADFADAWRWPGAKPGRFRPLQTLEAEVDKIKRLTTGRIHENVRMAMIINTWNAVRTGQRGRRDIIIWDETQPFPEIK